MLNRSKKAFITLEELIKMIPHLLLLLLVVFILVQAYTIFYSEEPTQPMNDLNRIIAEIEDLNQGEEITVPIIGEQYTIEKNENSPTIDAECKKLCLCVREEEDRHITLCKAVKDKEIITTSTYITNQKTIRLSHDSENRLHLTAS